MIQKSNFVGVVSFSLPRETPLGLTWAILIQLSKTTTLYWVGEELQEDVGLIHTNYRLLSLFYFGGEQYFLSLGTDIHM